MHAKDHRKRQPKIRQYGNCTRMQLTRVKTIYVDPALQSRGGRDATAETGEKRVQQRRRLAEQQQIGEIEVKTEKWH